jgi:hypothetical protein
MFDKYISYMKDNPNHYWFKRKLYGWGWTPATWEGWLATGLFVLLLILNVLTIDTQAPTDSQMKWYFVRVGVIVVALLAVCFRTGEKPKWQWGGPKSDNHK